MLKICGICNDKFETSSSTRIYCYECSGESTREDKNKTEYQKTSKNNIKKEYEKTISKKRKEKNNK